MGGGWSWGGDQGSNREDVAIAQSHSAVFVMLSCIPRVQEKRDQFNLAIGTELLIDKQFLHSFAFSGQEAASKDSSQTLPEQLLVDMEMIFPDVFKSMTL